MFKEMQEESILNPYGMEIEVHSRGKSTTTVKVDPINSIPNYPLITIFKISKFRAK